MYIIFLQSPGRISILGGTSDDATTAWRNALRYEYLMNVKDYSPMCDKYREMYHRLPQQTFPDEAFLAEWDEARQTAWIFGLFLATRDCHMGYVRTAYPIATGEMNTLSPDLEALDKIKHRDN
jgi:hypothetical protein